MDINLKSLFPVDESVASLDVLTHLLKSLKEAHTSGIDYLKFKHSAEALKAINSDEATALKSALISMSSFGLTKEALLESIVFYNSILNQERRKFVNSLANQLDTQVNQKTVEVEKLNERKAANLRSIEKLQQENVIIDQKITEITSEQAQAKEKIEGVAARFETTYKALQDVILKDQTQYQNTL